MSSALRRIFHIIVILFYFASGVSAHDNPKTYSKGLSPLPLDLKSAFEIIPISEFDNIPVEGTLEFRNIDFGKGNLIDGFIARVKASYIPTGWIEIRLDSPVGLQIGMCLISQRDGGKDWYVAQTGIYPLEGVHSVFLVFTGINYSGFSPEIEWFSFTKQNARIDPYPGKKVLPPQVPYLGPLEKNFFGNGIAGAGGDTNGVWDYLIGPAYSSMSFIDEEKIVIILKGKEYPLGNSLKRARGTGIFYSTNEIEGLSLCLVDFALQNTPFLTRAIFVKNRAKEPATFAIKVCLKPSAVSKIIKPDNSITDSVPDALALLTMVAQGKFGMTISMNNALSVTGHEETGYFIRSEQTTLLPGREYQTGIYHYAHQPNADTEGITLAIRKRDVENDLNACIINWNKWLSEGISLEKVKDQRGRDVIEANAILLKMLQGEDGGIMTAPRIYRTSYIRDTHNALRGLIATGHTLEARNYLFWVHNKFKTLQAKGQFPIPNAAEIGSDGFFAGFGDEDNWSSETPGLYLLIADNYFRKTNDLETLMKIDESLCFSMKCQLDCAEKNGWKLPFNMDETESGGSGIKIWDQPGKWSLPSLLICDASLRFFMTYLEKTGKSKLLNEYREDLKMIRNSVDMNFWNDEKKMYDWYRGKNGEKPRLPIPNYVMMPVYFHYPVSDPRLAIKSVEKMKQFVNSRGFIPNQPGNLHGDFCGHAQGYLLYALSEINDPMKDRIFNSMIFGGTMGCWGTWSESYTGDGLSYGTCGGHQYWTNQSIVHNLRAFENGTNLDAILRYLDLNSWE